MWWAWKVAWSRRPSRAAWSIVSPKRLGIGPAWKSLGASRLGAPKALRKVISSVIVLPKCGYVVGFGFFVDGVLAKWRRTPWPMEQTAVDRADSTAADRARF